MLYSTLTVYLHSTFYIILDMFKIFIDRWAIFLIRHIFNFVSLKMIAIFSLKFDI